MLSLTRTSALALRDALTNAVTYAGNRLEAECRLDDRDELDAALASAGEVVELAGGAAEAAEYFGFEGIAD